jgi:GMP synthase-like glutamine amidotransferase
MRIAAIQHEEFEDPAHLLVWAGDRRHSVERIRVYENAHFPPLDSFDWLWIMGGAMGVHDTDVYSWLVDEKIFIRKAVDSKKRILGICLGAQLLAEVLGARVFPNTHMEIGWFPVRLLPEARKAPLFAETKESFSAFHWHNDAFDLPRGAVPFAESDACACQGFFFGDNVLALQFHPEATVESVRPLAETFGDELPDGPFIQKRHELLIGAGFHAQAGNHWLDHVLDAWLAGKGLPAGPLFHEPADQTVL